MRRQAGRLLFGFIVLSINAAAIGQTTDYTSADDYPSFLQAQQVVILSSELDGRVNTIYAEPQDFVSEGQPLLALDFSLAQLALETVEANLQANEIGAQETKVRKEFADDNLKIVQELFDNAVGDVPVASRKELKESQQTAQLAALAVDKNALERDSLLIEQRRAQEIYARHTIKAPFDGVVVPFTSVSMKYMQDRGQPKRVEVGETVRAGQVVMALMKIDVLRVSHWLHVSQLARVKLGDKALVYIEGGEKPVEAQIVFISPTVNPTGDFGVEVEFANPPLQPAPASQRSYRYQYRDGLRARVELIDAGADTTP